MIALELLFPKSELEAEDEARRQTLWGQQKL